MKIRIVSILSVAILIIATCPPDALGGKKKGPLADQVKALVLSIGTGTDAHVKVRLQSGQEIVGYVSEARANDFLIANANGTTATVSYGEVSRIHAKNVGTGAGGSLPHVEGGKRLVLLVGIVGGLLLIGILAARD